MIQRNSLMIKAMAILLALNLAILSHPAVAVQESTGDVAPNLQLTPGPPSGDDLWDLLFYVNAEDTVGSQLLLGAAFAFGNFYVSGSGASSGNAGTINSISFLKMAASRTAPRNPISDPAGAGAIWLSMERCSMPDANRPIFWASIPAERSWIRFFDLPPCQSPTAWPTIHPRITSGLEAFKMTS